MKLRDLEGQLIRYEPYTDTWVEIREGRRLEVTGIRQSWKDVVALSEATGVSFVCPICLQKNTGRRPGVHSWICWFHGVPLPEQGGPHPAPGRWHVASDCTGLDDLTFCGPGAFSVALPCGHGYVENGEFNIR
jgi:hypothetical protein